MKERNRETYQEKPSRTILGIDPGTGRVGWAILEKIIKNKELRIANQTNLLDYGCLETVANTPLPERLEYIHKEVGKVIKKFKPDELAIEELFFVKNVKTGMSVAHARGVVILAAKQSKLEIFEYKPNEIKVAITGYGHADKSQIRKMLKLHLKGCGAPRSIFKEGGQWGNIKQDDAADAVAVALTHLQCARKF